MMEGLKTKIEIRCVGCGNVLEVLVNDPRKELQCTRCGTMIPLPEKKEKVEEKTCPKCHQELPKCVCKLIEGFVVGEVVEPKEKWETDKEFLERIRKNHENYQSFLDDEEK